MQNVFQTYFFLLLVSVIMILPVVLYFTFISYYSPTNNQSQILCASNQCVVNLNTGKKSCPTSGAISFNPKFETCSDKLSCPSTLAFAVNLDSSTNYNSTCQNGIACSCSKNFQCPEYILSSFKKTTQSTNYEFEQISFEDQLPIQIKNPNFQYCLANINWLGVSNPGCKFLKNNTGNVFTLPELSLCMNSKNKPCKKGILSFVTESEKDITKSNYFQFDLGCTVGNECEGEQVSIFDKQLGYNVCKILD